MEHEQKMMTAAEALSRATEPLIWRLIDKVAVNEREAASQADGAKIAMMQASEAIRALRGFGFEVVRAGENEKAVTPLHMTIDLERGRDGAWRAQAGGLPLPEIVAATPGEAVASVLADALEDCRRRGKL